MVHKAVTLISNLWSGGSVLSVPEAAEDVASRLVLMCWMKLCCKCCSLAHLSRDSAFTLCLDFNSFHSQPASFTDKEVEATRGRRNCTPMLWKAHKKKTSVFCSSTLELGCISTLKEHRHETKGFSQWDLRFLTFKPLCSHSKVELRSGAQGHRSAQWWHTAYAAPLTKPTGSFKLAESAATNQTVLFEDRQMDGLLSRQALPPNTLESLLNGCVVGNGEFKEGSSGPAKLRTRDSWAESVPEIQT